MKIRKGFVSNSSSSSFTCDVCGEEHSGWDACIEDADMWSCSNGHTFCDSHLIHPVDDEVCRDYLLKEVVEDVDQEKIKQLNEEELEEYLEENEDYIYDMRYELPPKCCPICNFVNIDPEDAVKYLMKKNNLTMDTLVEKIKSEFKDYDAFFKYIKHEAKKDEN